MPFLEIPLWVSPERIFKKYWIVPESLGIEGIKAYQVRIGGGKTFGFAILTDESGDIRCYTSFSSSIIGIRLNLLSSEAKLIVQSIAAKLK